MEYKKLLVKQKKGAVTDIFVFMIIAFILALLCVMFLYISQITNEAFMNNTEAFQSMYGDSNEVNATVIITETFGQVPTAFEALKWITTMLIVGMMISLFISAFLIRTHPVMLFVHIIIVIIAIVCSVAMSNAYMEIYASPTLAQYFTGFWGQNFIFENLPVWVTLIGFTQIIILLANMVREGGGSPGGYYG